jgi:hypothetical protein
MRIHAYQVINDTDDDCFALTDDYETALSEARAAARERPTETILITYKGFPIREMSHTTDGQLAEEELTTPEEVDRTLRTLTPPAVGKQP